MRVGSIIYFIPFFFVLNPALVMEGHWAEGLLLMAKVGVGTLFICGGIQGYQVFVGDLRGTGALEWPMRIALMIGGMVLAVPGGGLMSFSTTQVTLAALVVLAPAVALSKIRIRAALA